MRLAAADWRTARSLALIFLPSAAFAVFAWLFCAREIPRIERDAALRAAAECEEVAAKLREKPSRATFVWRKGKGVVSGRPTRREYPATMLWKDWHSVTHRRGEAWGWLDDGGRGRTVWARGAGDENEYQTAYALETDIEPGRAAAMLRVAIPASAVLLFALALFGAKSLLANIRMRDDFVAAVAHDLANPLLGMRYAIRDDTATALRINERLSRIVANMRDFVCTRRSAPQRVAFDIVAAFDEAYAVFAPDYREARGGRDMEKSFPRGAPPPALGDPTLAVQILWNVIGNAIKYAASSGDVKAVFSADGAGRVAVAVCDEGPGMPPRESAKAFDRYYRAKAARRSGKDGFGIGLCSAKEHALSMGGDLTLSPNKPHGCIFTLALPAAEKEETDG